MLWILVTSKRASFEPDLVVLLFAWLHCCYVGLEGLSLKAKSPGKAAAPGASNKKAHKKTVGSQFRKGGPHPRL